MTTKTHQVMIGGLVCVLCAAGALVWSGCDTASATEDLTISPSAAALSSGQSQEFSVSGGYQYDWQILSGAATGSNVTTTATGWLSSRTGSRVVYTAPSGSSLSGAVTLRVTSIIEGTAVGTSNSPSYAVYADAIVTFK